MVFDTLKSQNKKINQIAFTELCSCCLNKFFAVHGNIYIIYDAFCTHKKVLAYICATYIAKEVSGKYENTKNRDQLRNWEDISYLLSHYNYYLTSTHTKTQTESLNFVAFEWQRMEWIHNTRHPLFASKAVE